ncbi:MAG TPA: hypothetical protein VMY76_12975 [Gemmatimonadales bacterium]|nr:hypothetical protein [Gemmatimonadales bacterium]
MHSPTLHPSKPRPPAPFGPARPSGLGATPDLAMVLLAAMLLAALG